MAARRPLDYGLPNGAAKKHDDPQEIPWMAPNPMRRCLGSFRKRRIVLVLAAAWLLYMFVQNIPTDLAPASQRFDSRFGRLIPTAQPHGAHSPNPLEEEYDGPVRFFNLAPSLRSIVKEPLDRSNVLFAFASVHSASNVVTAACSMAAHNRSRVHVAAMSKDEITLEKVLELNVIALSDCPVRWHNAQVDFAAQSSPLRLGRGTQGSFGHIHRALSLNAVFFDGSKQEEDYLRSGISKVARENNVAAIKLPHAESWMLALSGPSLRWWNKIQIDIIIRVQPESAGSLMRLMRNLRSADYGGLPLPRIVLDLPPRADPHILDNLQQFTWPAGDSIAESKLSIRRRVDDNAVSGRMASVQMVESFYPMDPDSSHVLVLTPAVEVAHNYYQLLMYLILEYRYSRPAGGLANNMMGVSLLNLAYATNDKEPIVAAQSLQADAILYFGEKWAELHEYLSLRLMADPELSKSVEGDGLDTSKDATWVTLAAEMMRAQGYFVLFPWISRMESPLAAMHTELQQPLEEHYDQQPAATNTLELGTEKGVLKADSGKSGLAEEARQLSSASLLSLIHHQQKGLDEIPFYSHQGKPVDTRALEEQAAKYAETLAVKIGGCPPSQAGRPPGDLGLLFC